MRLAVKTGAWSATPGEWQRALSLVEQWEPMEAQRILRLKMEEDRKRSLIGRLLLRHACALHTGIEPGKLRMMRTDENKPICMDLETGEVNISHHGEWVVLASDPERRIGVDVMKYEEPRRGIDAFFASMRGQFTENEWTLIGSSLRRFYQFWALKESYIKAIGIGLGFQLQRANFHILGTNQAQVDIDGRLAEDWIFYLSEIDDFHCVAVAIGPPRSDQFKTIRTANAPFTILSVDELLGKLG